MPILLPIVGSVEAASAKAGLIGAGTVVLVWAVWILFDPYAPDGFGLLLHDLRPRWRRRSPLGYGEKAHALNRLGVRVAVAVLLCFGGAVSLTLYGVGLLSLASDDLPLAVGGMVVVFCAAGALLAFHERLSFAGFLLRLWCRRHRLCRLAEDLRQDWPQRDGEMPILGNYRCDATAPDILTLDVDTRCPLYERFGPLVRRTLDGSICMDITGLVWKVELVKDGVLPASFDDVFESGPGDIGRFAIHNDLERAIRVDRTTFASKYTSSFRVEDADALARLDAVLQDMVHKLTEEQR
jgi:hypothetical protein